MSKNTLQELIAIAIPMVVSQGAFAIMIFTDRFFMSMISPTHMAASLGGGVTFYFCISLFIGLLSYANALVAQYYGSGQWGKCSRVLTQGIALCILFVPLLVVITLAASNMFVAMGHDPAQAEMEETYFLVLMWGSVIVLIKACFASFFSGIGKTKAVMVADSIGVAINIPLSYILIFGELGFSEMGIVGAAVGTIVSNVIALGIFTSFYFSEKNWVKFKVAQSFTFDKGIFTRYLRLGFPSGMEMFLNVAAFNLFLLMFQSYGVAQGTSAAIVFNWDILSFVPMIGLNIGITSLMGRYIGAGNMASSNQVIASGFLLGLGYSSILALIFVIFRQPLVELFIRPGEYYQEISDLSAFMMLGLASYVMADAIILVSGGVLRGAGDTRWMMFASVTLHWAMLIAQILVIKVFEFGPEASWVIFVGMIICIAVVYLWRLNGHKWRDPQALERMMAEH